MGWRTERGSWIFEAEESLADGGVDLPAAGFLHGAVLCLDEEAGEVGESAGTLRRETLGGEGVEELPYGVVDVELHDEVSGGAGGWSGAHG